MNEALKVFLATMTAFNTLAPATAQIIAVLRKPNGEEMPLTDLIDGVAAKNAHGIDLANEYLATHPKE